ncbi:hypothetical protein EJB05_11864, partial [Eragrostis curvula]
MAQPAVAAALAAVVLVLLHTHDAATRVDAAALGPTLSPGQSLGENDKLVSANGTFELRFFSPRGGDPGRRYLGVMYARAREQTVPWVANRDAPVSAAASAYSATVTADGELQVLEGDRIAWRTNTYSPPVVGNLVLTSGRRAQVLWQSFDHPTDTFLPGGMRIALYWQNGVGRVNRTLYTSWRGSGDPATGDFTLGLDPLGSWQLYIWESRNGTNVTTYGRSGQQWGTGYVGQFRLYYHTSHNDSSTYYTYVSSSFDRFMLHPNGTWVYSLLDDTGEWETLWSQPTFRCETYNTCGANAVCAAGDNGQAICKCLEGFEPRSAAEYNNGNWTQGCVRSAPLTCKQSASGGDHFVLFPGVKPPNFATSVSTASDKDQCRRWCLSNCSCAGYSINSGNGCMTWGAELLDTYEFPNGDGYDLSIKVPATSVSVSEIGSTQKTRRWTIVVIGIVIMMVLAVLAPCRFLLWKCKRRIKGEGTRSYGTAKFESAIQSYPTMSSPCMTTDKLVHPAEKLGIGGTGHKCQAFSGFLMISEEAENGKKLELPLFPFETLSAATGDFSSANKLGEGGFGQVYKGKLPGGEEVAVRRLSRSSAQGLQELKNKVLLIAKLQHRNLVKLLGCCLQGEEKILVYEFMPNKSLDAFLFDPAGRELLDWKTRLHIIDGIARGLLYLHRDSRLRVVHRDLKASNILLDADMNPKISDFGLARIFGGELNQQVNTNRVVGTLGYMSPEYAMKGLFSVRSDVYSFGILVLEIVSGQKNSSFHHMEESLNIVGYAWQLWDAGKGEELIDPAVRAGCPAREALRCVHLALLCVQDHASDRPDIPYVVMALGSDSAVLPVPKPPTFTLQCTSWEREGLFRVDRADESYSACDLTVSVMHGR